MIIDCHTHGMHGKHLDAMAKIGGKWFETLMVEARSKWPKKPGYMDVKARMEMLERNNYDYQVVTPQWTFDSNLYPLSQRNRLAYSRALNDNMAHLGEDSKGRLLPIGNVPLEDFENGPRQELERAVKTLGLKGVFISSNLRGKPIDAKEFEPFWASVEKLKVPVLIHPCDAIKGTFRPYEDQYDIMHNFGWPYETEIMLARLVFSGIMERYPNLIIFSHHLGGGLPFMFGRTMETFSGRLPEKIGYDLPKPLPEYFRKFYYDTAVGGSSAAIKCTREVFGLDHIVFATDAPFGPGSGEMRFATYPKVIKDCGFSAADNEKIFSGNARKLFGI